MGKLGKSTISTGPFSSSQTVSLPEASVYHVSTSLKVDGNQQKSL